ncbi:hypothetical protein Slala03_35990 [Streptomyces lavendulae subsp. lavendulae]|uniref:hypothetical protein n=1 Tax=Streptomyces lavendulae TaxID=1914 RepID=UPI0024A5C38E|nr:hypothetical protein [Streptomyces lavendulae]GLV83910.1 hypothetical protein Slala03_35990 [Streptomyces lavendulae subsp. lavendulae]
MHTMKKIKAVVLAAAAIAGLSLATAPAAQASTCEAGGGGLYICEYGVTDHALPGGHKEQFIVGTDEAMWTRHNMDGKWSGWVYLGGVFRGRIYVQERPDPTYPYAITVYGTGPGEKAWGTKRMAPGLKWSPFFCMQCGG